MLTEGANGGLSVQNGGFVAKSNRIRRKMYDKSENVFDSAKHFRFGETFPALCHTALTNFGGCARSTRWDPEFLARHEMMRMRPRDVRGGSGGGLEISVWCAVLTVCCALPPVLCHCSSMASLQKSSRLAFSFSRCADADESSCASSDLFLPL